MASRDVGLVAMDHELVVLHTELLSDLRPKRKKRSWQDLLEGENMGQWRSETSMSPFIDRKLFREVNLPHSQLLNGCRSQLLQGVSRDL